MPIRIIIEKCAIKFASVSTSDPESRGTGFSNDSPICKLKGLLDDFPLNATLDGNLVGAGSTYDLDAKRRG